MQSKDLRIGNLVGSIGIEYLVWKIDGLGNIQGIDGGTTFNLDKTTYPIEITNERLEKIGFEENFKQYELQNFGLKVVKDVNSNVWICYVGFLNQFNEICTIKYVHQLQNLYFALTGEELELKNESKP